MTDDDEWLAALIKMVSEYTDRISAEMCPLAAARLCYLAGMEAGLNIANNPTCRHGQQVLDAFLAAVHKEVGQASDSPLDWPLQAAGPGRIEE